MINTVKKIAEEKAHVESPKCGRVFRKENQSHYCGKAPETVEEYIAAWPEDIQLYLRALN